MDPKFAGETLNHIEKEIGLFMDAHRSLSHELHTLQCNNAGLEEQMSTFCKVEEEMLMRKLYELMLAHGLTNNGAGRTVLEEQFHATNNGQK